MIEFRVDVEEIFGWVIATGIVVYLSIGILAGRTVYRRLRRVNEFREGVKDMDVGSSFLTVFLWPAVVALAVLFGVCRIIALTVTAGQDDSGEGKKS